ncbi:hypothetical protein R6258_06745 [Halomonas sp. HP20-15]|uniref:hypothetical protein n=1 Tax=Halomonas sp. HP20-15 TaxID=3085901 RepID=UPI0029811562|nr:hypothetical protein [Halomonas sp. HP20-15]MDW5376614.1 hypothetical protein [Halomonas sp. HP20-15]
MKNVNQYKKVSIEEFESMKIEGYNVIKAAPEDGRDVGADNDDRAIYLWTDRDLGSFLQFGSGQETETISVLQVLVPDIEDKNLIERLRSLAEEKLG